MSETLTPISEHTLPLLHGVAEPGMLPYNACCRWHLPNVARFSSWPKALPDLSAGQPLTLDRFIHQCWTHGCQTGWVERTRNEPCVYCGKDAKDGEVPGKTYRTIDHIVPRSKGGRNSWENCVPACYGCNHRKSTKPLLMFLLTDKQALMAHWWVDIGKKSGNRGRGRKHKRRLIITHPALLRNQPCTTPSAIA